MNEKTSRLNAKSESGDQKIENASKSSEREKFVIHLITGFHEICVVTAALPLITLFLCFVTSYIYQFEEVHETHCRVYNVIPSISAITGVSPQRYFWRICIALHIGPRIPIAIIYRSYYRNNLINNELTNDVHNKANLLINIVFWLHIIEIASLSGVTYVSNRENYPIHEKIFITFMFCSLCHMLATIKLYEILHPKTSMTDKQVKSLKWKKIIFAVSIGSTIGLFLFFLKHRLFCHELAFSWFALCEYIIASANMAFHCTTMFDFPSEYFIIAQGKPEKLFTETNRHHIHQDKLQQKDANKVE